MVEPTTGRWERRSTGLLVVAIVLVVFAPTLLFHRIGYDDHWLWSDDSPLRSLDADTLRTVLFELDARARHPLGTEYLPVRDLIVAADMAVWGDNERGPHATQLVLYALTVFAMGRLLIRFGLRADVAWLGTLLWALHPLHVESVAWLSERKGVLSGLFVVACGHAWVRYRTGGRGWWLVCAVLAAIAGVWSKAPAMFAPAVFAVWDLLILPPGRRRWHAIAAVGLAAALAAVPVLIVAQDAGVIDSEAELVDQSRFVRALGAQGHYVKGFVLAQQPSLAYDIQSEGAGGRDVVVGVAAVLASIALLWHGRRGKPWLLAMLAWGWIWFFPASHLVTSVHILVADRFVYMWTLAGCVGVAWLVLRMSAVPRLAAGAALVCVLSIATIRALGPWTSSLELFANAFATSPGDTRACQNLASELVAVGEPRRALEVIARGLAIHPRDPYLLNKQARLFAAVGQREDALRSSAHAAASGHASTMWYHAAILAQNGRLPEAIVFAERAARRRPETAQYTWTWVELLLAARRAAEAEPVIRALLEREPSAPTALLAAKVSIERGRFAAAHGHLALAVMLGGNLELAAEIRARIPTSRN